MSGLRRRDVLLGGVGLGLSAAGLDGVARALAPPRAIYFVPGYAPERAYHRGRPLPEDPLLARGVPDGFEGSLTLVTRIDETDGSVRRAVLPLSGHEITVSADGRRAVFNSLNDPHCVTFDPVSLDGATIRPHGEGWIGAGHALYLPGGEGLVIAERRPWAAFTGDPRDHHGRIAIRDPDGFALLEAFDCGGMAPHEIGLLDDGRHLAVANYGKTLWPDGSWRNGLMHRVAPSLTVLEIGSGRLVHEVRNADPRYEVRHLAAHGFERLFAIQARMETFAASQEAMAAWDDGVYEADVYSGGTDVGYLPAPLLRYRFGPEGATADPILTENPLLMRYGQSLVYDPVHDEVIATYPSRHAVVVFAGSDGHVRRVLRTDRIGLRQPRGVVLHPDGVHYAVSGYWQDVLTFRRGSHEPAPERHLHPVLFGHSHLSVAAAAAG
jgi:hypothetical protein